jgi:hypothetical protein
MNGWVRQSRMGLFRCDAERYVVVWQSWMGLFRCDAERYVVVWQSWMGSVWTFWVR